MKYLKALVLGAALSSLSFTPAFAVDVVKAEQLKVNRSGDIEMTCEQILDEAGKMQALIAQMNDIEGRSDMKEYGVTAVTGIGGFLIGTVTGGIGFAAAGLIASEAIEEGAENADELRDKAAERRSFMVGIYKAKECDGDISHTLDDTAQKAAYYGPPRPKRQNRTPSYND